MSETEPHGVPPIAISNTTTMVNKTGSWKYIRPVYRDGVAPCNEGCPVGIDIEAYMNLLRLDRLEEARELLLRENPLPATTGRVCYQPCEAACNRCNLDGAVSIRSVERMLGDAALNAPLPQPVPRTRSETIAVVGSGPAGLACAYHLARLGYGVTVLEAAAEAGGVLRLGIPAYRLPRNILDAEIERIRALGVEFRCHTRVGSDLPWSELDSFDAVFLATGVHRSRALGIPGEEGDGVRPGLDFLREVNGGGRPDIGEDVVVLGGGNTAMDCARTALRLGAEPTVLYRRTRAEMPAIDEEVEEAEDEGVSIKFLAAPTEVRRDNGRVVGLLCQRMRLGEADASGRRRPVPIEGSDFFLQADTVLAAIGEVPDFDSWPEEIGHDGQVVQVDGYGATTRVAVFAGGDLADQPHTVAHALGSGKRAAIGIDRHLRNAAANDDEALPDLDALRLGSGGNASITRWRNDDPVRRVEATNAVVRFEHLNMDHFDRRSREKENALPPHVASRGFEEIHAGLPPDAALREAGRCFNCGVCNDCELCLIFCPDIAISRRSNGDGFEIAYDYCKGCGVCAAECPRGAMAMIREGA
jgi:2-oxoacid:acceptor oxidoreductase delta subunit (pyruvate/2-ketoisovalerate family)